MKTVTERGVSVRRRCRTARVSAAWFPLVLLLVPAARAASPYAGEWEGHLVFRDEPLELRLTVDEGPEGLAVEVDLPQLVYADQPAAAEVADGALAVELPFGLGQASFRRDGERLVALPAEEEGVRVELAPAERFEPRREEVRFGAFEPELEGTLVLPPGSAGDGPYPLVVHLAGAGNPTRDNWSYASWSDPLARRGVASLIYDRRPDEDRGADGSAYGIEDQARDVAAALDRLEDDPRLDFDRLGVFGLSRGAWIALELAAGDPRVDFLVARGASAVGVEEQDYHRIAAQMRAEDEPEEAIAAALAHTRLYFHVVAHPEAWPALERATAAALEHDWGESARTARTPDDLVWFRRHLDFEPLRGISRLRIPVFYAWGVNDRATPPAANRPLFEALLDPEVAARSRLVVYPDASHTVEGPMNTDDDEEIVWGGMDQTFLADLWAWLGERGVIAGME